MKLIQNETFDQERALYGCDGLHAVHCSFDGPADGESAFKECRNVQASDCFFNLRYPFWHDVGLKISNCEMTQLCRAALWYSEDVEISHSKLHGINKFMIDMLVKMLDSKKDKGEDDIRMLELIKKGGDYVSADNLAEFLGWYEGEK